MDPNAQRSRGRAREADAYWQRRFFTLVAGLGVIGLLAWACSGVAGGKPASPASGSGQVSAAAYGSAAAGQPAGGRPAGGAGAASPAPSASSSVPVSASPGSPSASPAGSAAQRAASGRPATPASGTGKSRPVQAAAGNAACPAAGIVLTLLASKPSYGPHDQPRFQIDVVSTDVPACTFDTGPEALRVVVMHGGQAAWNSGACLHGVPPHVISLRRGVPVVLSIAWDRRLTATGCRPTIMAATNRTYVAVAQAGAAQSPWQSFRLTGSAAAGRRTWDFT